MTAFTQPMTAALRLQYEAARDAGYSGRAALTKVATDNGIDATHLEIALFAGISPLTTHTA